MANKIILAKTYGIIPNTGTDLSANFGALFTALKTIGVETTVEFETGVYDVYAESADKELAYITNTVGEKEVRSPIHTIGLNIKNVTNVELDFRGAVVVMHGAMSNMFIEYAENVKIKNLTLDHARPYATEMVVEKRSAYKATFRLRKDCQYQISQGKMYFFGDNWRMPADENASCSWWTTVSKNNDPERIARTWRHPFRYARKYKEIDDHFVEVKYYLPNAVEEGSVYNVFRLPRIEVGIFVNRSREVYLENVKQLFNISHAIVAQCSHNVTLDYCSFAPDKKTERTFASVTDFCHFNMCSGKIAITNCFFSGANDDCLNVHGVNFKIEDVEDNQLVVSFKHYQAYGFNPLDVGDQIVCVDGVGLVDVGEAKILASEQLDLYRIRLTVDAVPAGVKKGDLVEDVSKCADVFFADNYVSHITTRGVLVTTRGRVHIIENTFKKTGMSAILMSDDGNDWYESGPVRDVTIQGNKFVECNGPVIYIKPEIKKYKGAVHKNILIENNTFILKDTTAIYALATERLGIKGNEFRGDIGSRPLIDCTEVADLHVIENDLERNYIIKR